MNSYHRRGNHYYSTGSLALVGTLLTIALLSVALIITHL